MNQALAFSVLRAASCLAVQRSTAGCRRATQVWDPEPPFFQEAVGGAWQPTRLASRSVIGVRTQPGQITLTKMPSLYSSPLRTGRRDAGRGGSAEAQDIVAARSAFCMASKAMQVSCRRSDWGAPQPFSIRANSDLARAVDDSPRHSTLPRYRAHQCKLPPPSRLRPLRRKKRTEASRAPGGGMRLAGKMSAVGPHTFIRGTSGRIMWKTPSCAGRLRV